VSGSNFNPRNIQYIPPVKIFAFLELEQNWVFFKGLSDYVRNQKWNKAKDFGQHTRRPQWVPVLEIL